MVCTRLPAVDPELAMTSQVAASQVAAAAAQLQDHTHTGVLHSKGHGVHCT